MKTVLKWYRLESFELHTHLTFPSTVYFSLTLHVHIWLLGLPYIGYTKTNVSTDTQVYSKVQKNCGTKHQHKQSNCTAYYHFSTFINLNFKHLTN